MQEYYNRAMEVMNENFGHDVVMSLATMSDGNINVREVDCFYCDGKIYIMTHKNSKKIKDIAKCPKVALCRHVSTLYGTAKEIGHPLDEINTELRKVLKKEFSLFYKDNVMEHDPDTCIMEITLTKVETYTRYHRYMIDFQTGEAYRDHNLPEYVYH